MSGKNPKVIGEAAADVALELADRPAKPKRTRKAATDKPAARAAVTRAMRSKA